MNNLRQLETGSSDNGVEIATTVIAACCLVLNVVGFLFFYFNKSRRSFDALLPNLIMFAFFFSGWINYNSIVSLHFSFFFTNNPLSHILEQVKIYDYITNHLINIAKLLNILTYSLCVPTSITLEILYCFESIHLFKNPVSSNKIRKIVYISIISVVNLIFMVLFCIQMRDVGMEGEEGEKRFSFQFLFDSITESNYLRQINKSLKFGCVLIILYYCVSLSSIPIIIKSIKTQSVLFTQEKSVFKKRHIIYVAISVFCLFQPCFFFIMHLNNSEEGLLSILSDKIFTYLFLNCNGIFCCIIRMLELDFSFFCKNKKRKIQFGESIVTESEDEGMSIGDFIKKNAPLIPNDTRSEASPKTEKTMSEPDIKSVRDNDEQYRQAPLSSKIMMNFLSESVYYTIYCILHSSSRRSDGCQIIKNDSYQYVNEHTFKISDHRIETINSKTITQNKQNGWLTNICNIFSNRIKITEYAPDIFHNLQELDKLKFDKIQESFDLNSNFKNLSKFHGSEGKSGSIFFFTHDKKFIIKTISEDELNALINNLLKPYYDLIATKNTTYLTRLYGAYTLKLGRSEINLVLMENLAPFSSDAFLFKYDLKGSTVGRKTKNIFSNKKSTLKDLDYLAIGNLEKRTKIMLTEQAVKTIKYEIKDDLNLLRDAKLMDYSMFIVIADKKKIDKRKLSNENRLFESAINPDCVYLMGIIDYLTRYGKKKIFENMVRSLFNDSNGISCVKPAKYKERFYNFMFKHVLVYKYDDEEDEIEEEEEKEERDTINTFKDEY